MTSLNVIFKISIIKLLKSPWTYVALITTILASIVAFVGLPIWYKPNDITAYFTNAWIVKSLQIMFVAWCLCGALIGETNSTSEEKNYFLSKDIKRNIFILAKTLSSIVVTTVICLLSLAILIGMAIYIHHLHKTNIFTDLGRSVNPFAIFFSFLVIVVFSSSISTIWKYNFRHGMVLIALTGFVFLYAILYNMFLPTLDPSGSIARLIWTSIPAIIFPPLTILLCWLGWNKFKNLQVES